jgi:hypothetical protein
MTSTALRPRSISNGAGRAATDTIRFGATIG